MKTVLAILGAVAAGVCIGLMIAPDKGSETRKKVAETTGDWADKFMNMFNRSDKTEGSTGRRLRSHRQASGQSQFKLP